MKEKLRCDWCLKEQVYIDYHDLEWGYPVHNDQKLFEAIVLDAFQAGLSWLTILKRRESFRKAFDGFNPEKIARYSDKKIFKLMNDEGIIRNKQKIEAAVTNARIFLNVQEEFGSFDKYIWQFTGYKTIINRPKTLKDLPAQSKESDLMSKDMRSKGFKFAGSTICYAFMQAVGMVDDHLQHCWRKKG
jgi:DNA-3-methyladenine glycosylase I